MANFVEFVLDGEVIAVNVDNVAYIKSAAAYEADIYFVGATEPLRVGMSKRDLLLSLKNPHLRILEG